MRRFGIGQLVVDRRYEEIFTPNFCGHAPRGGGQVDENSPPLIIYFPTAEERDAAMVEVTEKWPGKTFCPFEVTSATRRAIGDIINMTVNDRGLLPT